MTTQAGWMQAGAMALVLMAGTASAQGVRFSEIDTDGNGSLSHDELSAVFGSSGADRIWSRGPGRALSADDIRRINADRDDDDDDDRGWRGGRDGDDDDGGRDDDDDDGGRDDDDDDGGRDDDDDDGRDDDDDGGRDDDDD